MKARFDLKANRANGDSYRYDPNSPLVDQRGRFLRAGTSEEMARIVETTECAVNPGKTNAKDIPVFLMYDANKVDPEPLNVSIPKEVNKYYCQLSSFKAHPSGCFPNNAESLRNISKLHLQQALKDLKENEHSLPVTIVYQVGLNENHAATVAVRICDLDDPSKNEIMVINSLPGYETLEIGAVKGLHEAMKEGATAANKAKEPKIHMITPRYVDGITQATKDMNASCSLIGAAMQTSLENDLSFAEQYERQKGYMRTLVGPANEAVLRKDHQKILACVHPSKPEFNPQEVKSVLSQCERHNKKIDRNLAPVMNTPSNSQSIWEHRAALYKRQAGNELKPGTAEEFVMAIHGNPHLIQSAKEELNRKGLTLFDVCSRISDPEAVRNMFRNEALMAEIAKEGNKGKLIQQYKTIYNSMESDHSRAAPRRFFNESGPQTPDEFVKRVTTPDLILSAKAQLNAKGLTLFDICSRVSNPDAVRDMFMNPALMAEIKKEGNEGRLIQQHEAIYDSMWPDYRRATPIFSNQRNEESEENQPHRLGM